MPVAYSSKFLKGYLGLLLEKVAIWTALCMDYLGAVTLPLTVSGFCCVPVDVLVQAKAYVPPTARTQDGSARPLCYPVLSLVAAHFLLS